MFVVFVLTIKTLARVANLAVTVAKTSKVAGCICSVLLLETLGDVFVVGC